MIAPARPVLPCILVLIAALVLASAAPGRAQEVAPPSADEVARLRAELESLRAEYTARLAALEARLDALAPGSAGPPGAPAPSPPPSAPAPLPPEAVVPAGAAGADGPTGALPIYGGPASGSKVFNPDIAVIGNFLGIAGDNTSAETPALAFDEAEASFQAVVDPYARADFFFAFSPEGVEIEEGYLTFPTLPGDFLMKVGKMKAAFGKANAFHTHNRPWVDQPLVSRNLVGGDEGLSDAGISLARLFPNDLLFLEATAEVTAGHSSVFAAPERSDLAYVGRLRAYRDLTESTNLDLGGSIAYGHNGLTADSRTRLIGADLAFRWRPLRRSRYRGFVGRTEFVWSRTEDGAAIQDSFGMYASAEYQFARRWLAGLRYDLSDRALDAAVRDEGISALVTFWPSEFSQIRAQYRRTVLGDQDCTNELLFQFLFSIGAHGAHPF